MTRLLSRKSVIARSHRKRVRNIDRSESIHHRTRIVTVAIAVRAAVTAPAKKKSSNVKSPKSTRKTSAAGMKPLANGKRTVKISMWKYCMSHQKCTTSVVMRNGNNMPNNWNVQQLMTGNDRPIQSPTITNPNGTVQMTNLNVKGEILQFLI